MKFLISTVIVAVIIFLLGGWLSNGFLTSEIFWPWVIVSAIGGVVGSLKFITDPKVTA